MTTTLASADSVNLSPYWDQTSPLSPLVNPQEFQDTTDYRYVLTGTDDSETHITTYYVLDRFTNTSSSAVNVSPDGNVYTSTFSWLDDSGQYYYFKPSNSQSYYKRDVAQGTLTVVYTTNEDITAFSNDGSRALIGGCATGNANDQCPFRLIDTATGDTIFDAPNVPVEGTNNSVFESYNSAHMSHDGRYLAYIHRSPVMNGTHVDRYVTTINTYDTQLAIGHQIFDSNNSYGIPVVPVIYSLSNDGNYLTTNTVDPRLLATLPGGFESSIVRYNLVDNTASFAAVDSLGNNPVWPLNGYAVLNVHLRFLATSDNGQRVVFEASSANALTPDSALVNGMYSGTYIHDFVSGDTRLISPYLNVQNYDSTQANIDSIGLDGSKIYYNYLAVLYTANATTFIDSRDITAPVVSAINWVSQTRPVHTAEGSGGFFTVDATDTQSPIIAFSFSVDGQPFSTSYISNQEPSPYGNVLDGWSIGVHSISYKVMDGAGNWSEPFSSNFYVISDAPDAPTGLIVGSPTNKPVLSWDSVFGAETYNVYRDGNNIGTTSDTNFIDSSSLIDGATYSYYVTAATSNGESSPSNTVDVVIDKTRPNVVVSSPSSLGGTYSSGPTITVTASDSGSGLKQLVIHVYKSNGQLLTTCGTANAAQLAAGSQTCSLAGLADGSYYIKTGAFDNAGNNKTITTATFTISH